MLHGCTNGLDHRAVSFPRLLVLSMIVCTCRPSAWCSRSAPPCRQRHEGDLLHVIPPYCWAWLLSRSVLVFWPLWCALLHGGLAPVSLRLGLYFAVQDSFSFSAQSLTLCKDHSVRFLFFVFCRIFPCLFQVSSGFFSPAIRRSSPPSRGQVFGFPVPLAASFDGLNQFSCSVFVSLRGPLETGPPFDHCVPPLSFFVSGYSIP